MNAHARYLDPVGVEITKTGTRRIVRNQQGRVSSFPRLSDGEVAYIEWLRVRRRGELADRLAAEHDGDTDA